MDSRAKFVEWFKSYYEAYVEMYKDGGIDKFNREKIDDLFSAFHGGFSSAKEQSETVAWMFENVIGERTFSAGKDMPEIYGLGANRVRKTLLPLYASPQPAQAWLPIADVQIEGKVLALSVSGEISIQYCSTILGLIRAAKTDGDLCNYTHYMPLPEAPKQEAGE